LSERLSALQDALARLYRLPETPSVTAFVCDAALTRALAGDEVVARGEALVVVEHDDDISLGLYLRDDALRAGAPDPFHCDADFDASCLAAEGVSHFVYLQYRSARDGRATELELELQAEVDKWALGVVGPEALAGKSRSSRSGAGRCASGCSRTRRSAIPRAASAATATAPRSGSLRATPPSSSAATSTKASSRAC
jgi:hypothetical protein